ncbi:hypothetical protein GQ55_3G423000 [Panicum hallii var. hallii]|uniref:Uncharacterized protein n=1 Tax=Panicum hallii var. hallii TaxID=1504633 RepID=A0A2T7EHI4_9POAL|nr:hypothetical protein GQ55_3G423000 [Panicum hallii var. hallii]
MAKPNREEGRVQELKKAHSHANVHMFQTFEFYFSRKGKQREHQFNTAYGDFEGLHLFLRSLILSSSTKH